MNRKSEVATHVHFNKGKFIRILENKYRNKL